MVCHRDKKPEQWILASSRGSNHRVSFSTLCGALHRVEQEPCTGFKKNICDKVEIEPNPEYLFKNGPF